MRKVIYVVLTFVVAVMIAASCIHQYSISRYQRAGDSLKDGFQKDDRFGRVRVFLSTQPSAWVLAPTDLPPSAKRDLSNLVYNAFGPLPVPIRYADSNFLAK
jgi:hypothetical protein